MNNTPSERNKNKKRMTVSEITRRFKDYHIYIFVEAGGNFCAICQCNKNIFHVGYLDVFNCHLKSKKHLVYAQSIKDTQKVEVKLTNNRLNVPIQRWLRLHTSDIVVCKKLLFSR